MVSKQLLYFFRYKTLMSIKKNGLNPIYDEKSKTGEFKPPLCTMRNRWMTYV